MAGMYGMNLEQIGSMITQLNTHQQSIEGVISGVDGLVAQHVGTDWMGPDAEGFRDSWQSEWKTVLTNAKTMLEATQQRLNAEKAAQDAASARGGA